MDEQNKLSVQELESLLLQLAQEEWPPGSEETTLKQLFETLEPHA